jgi:predicted GIY-YIG superfamily endonuclease
MDMKVKDAEMKSQGCYFAYLLANLSGTLYAGLTDNFGNEHRSTEQFCSILSPGSTR